jgi:uncharacterized protein YjbJ (UPF0337 family)
VLVRPDGHIAWTAPGPPVDTELLSALQRILTHSSCPDRTDLSLITVDVRCYDHQATSSQPGYCRQSGRPPGWGVPNKEDAMSLADKAENKAEELKGKGKEAAGRATDDDELKAEGKTDQAKGNLKQAGEKIKDVFK